MLKKLGPDESVEVPVQDPVGIPDLVAGAMISLIIAWGGSIGLAKGGRVAFAAEQFEGGVNWFAWRNESNLRTIVSVECSRAPLDDDPDRMTPGDLLPAWSAFDADRIREHRAEYKKLAESYKLMQAQNQKMRQDVTRIMQQKGMGGALRQLFGG